MRRLRRALIAITVGLLLNTHCDGVDDAYALPED
ncbi:MAG: hypothetical protein ACI9U2_001692 [Bradymonadia bacterium]|jgi:hypothetical protein